VCPECGSDQVAIHEFDFGVCPQTGYHDAGQRFQCGACGATGDADELCPLPAVEFLGSFRAEYSGALHDCTISLASGVNSGRHLGSSGRHA
jgi:hypothetical protein